MHCFVTACLLLGFTVFMGCTSSSDDDLLALLMQDTTQLSSYVEDVREITPYLGTATDLSLWDDGWNSDTEFSVFYKIFNPDNGVECIFNPLDTLDGFIEMINEFSSSWDTDVDSVEVTAGDSEVTVSIDNNVTSVDVPFFGDTVSVDRVISVSSDAEGFTVNLAFTVDSDAEALVAHFELDSGEIGTFYATRNGDTDIIELWSACYTDDFKGSFKWKGNPEEDWFAITHYTDSTDTDWSVMGGGSVNGDMAFIGKNGDTVGEYYVVVDIDDIEGDGVHADPGTITLITDEAPDPVTTPVHAYITAGNASCLGYLTEFPESAEDIAWEN